MNKEQENYGMFGSRPLTEEEKAAQRRQEREKEGEAKETKEKAAHEAKEKSSKEQGGSWLNRSITADLAGVAKTVAGGKELTGQNSLTSSLAQLIEKGQAKAQEQLSREREQSKEQER